MRVLVTGGAGYVGRFVVRELVARGHEVTAAGRRPDQVVEGASYRVLDTTDYEAVVQALAGFDAVAHLAALPVPKPGLDVALFDANVRGTFHLFEACAANGIGTVAVASSINALGNKFGVRRIPVHYLPVDEDHPPLTTDSYSFSKQLTERIAQYAWDRHQIRSVSLRFPGVIDPVERPGTRFRHVLSSDTTKPWRRTSSVWSTPATSPPPLRLAWRPTTKARIRCSSTTQPTASACRRAIWWPSTTRPSPTSGRRWMAMPR